jgi:hypothetical protein
LPSFPHVEHQNNSASQSHGQYFSVEREFSTFSDFFMHFELAFRWKIHNERLFPVSIKPYFKKVSLVMWVNPS